MRLNVVIIRVAKVNDSLLKRESSLLVGVGARYAVSAVNLCINEIFLYVDVLLDVLDSLVVVRLREVVSLDERALNSYERIRRVAESRCLGYLTAARLIFQSFLVCAVVNDLVALRFCKRGIRRVNGSGVNGAVEKCRICVLLAVEVNDVDLVVALAYLDVRILQKYLELGVLNAVLD